MQIHVDPLGGWSGDMFVAGLLDAFPQLWADVQAAVAALDLGPGAGCRLVDHRDHVLTGRRFLVAAEALGPAAHDHHHAHHGHDHAHRSDDHDHDPHGEHRAWVDIRRMLQGAPLTTAVRDHAVAIFALLAKAEAAVHGVAEDDVAFHEVGAVDSIVDIVAAAVLIARLGATRWTASPLPLGGGRVRTAHGLLPVPAPATALLLEGLTTIDDAIGGERVTPTGAAVARHLLRDTPPGRPRARRLVATGTGFGTRTLPGISNCLRVLAFDETEGPSAQAGAVLHRALGVVTFEVDDQSPEDLAHGLDHIRALPGVHDVIHGITFGKKGRMAMQVQVLATPEALEAVIMACFEETTTIGLRHQVVQGAALARAFETVEIEGRSLRVKTVRRPLGRVTGKTEAADVAAEPGHARRAALRRGGEDAALSARDRADRLEDADDVG